VLVATVVGSGIMGERLAGENAAVVLLGNTLATGTILVVLITAFGRVSGAHFNPAVTLAIAALGEIAPMRAVVYVAVQVAGGLAGTALAHAMFELPAFVASSHVRAGPAQWLAEAVATASLLLAILGTRAPQPEAVPLAVGLFISAGDWFTASTSFANPAVTVARAFTDTFSGIRPADAPYFVAAQLVAAVPAAMLWRWLFASAEERR